MVLVHASRSGWAQTEQDCAPIGFAGDAVEVFDDCERRLDRFADLIEEDLRRYWRAEAESLGRAFEEPSSEFYATQRTVCGSIIGANNAAYCDNRLHYHWPFLLDLFRTTPWLVGAVLAHEWGHWAQDRLELLDAKGLAAELHADCHAGGYLRAVFEGGRGLTLDSGRRTATRNAYHGFGTSREKPWTDVTTHGTAGNRLDALDQGLGHGASGCQQSGFLASIRVGRVDTGENWTRFMVSERFGPFAQRGGNWVRRVSDGPSFYKARYEDADGTDLWAYFLSRESAPERRELWHLLYDGALASLGFDRTFSGEMEDLSGARIGPWIRIEKDATGVVIWYTDRYVAQLEGRLELVKSFFDFAFHRPLVTG